MKSLGTDTAGLCGIVQVSSHSTGDVYLRNPGEKDTPGDEDVVDAQEVQDTTHHDLAGERVPGENGRVSPPPLETPLRHGAAGPLGRVSGGLDERF